MPDILLKESIPLPPEKAFDTFVADMDMWWPRQGVFPYSFAPKTTFPRRIRFEAQPGGRYYETFADGSEYTIGHITAWNPQARLEYTWRDPTWSGETLIRVSFVAEKGGTAVTYQQDGFAEAGVEWLIPYYQVGCVQTLAGYVAHCHALFSVQELGLRLD